VRIVLRINMRMTNLRTFRGEPTTKGTWIKVARKHYQHVTGIECRYDCNRWLWEIVGGAEDGRFYGTLWVAQHAAIRGLEAA